MCEVVYNVQDTMVWVCRNYTTLEPVPIRVPSSSSLRSEPSPSSLRSEPSSITPSSITPSSITPSPSSITVCPTCPTIRPCNLRPSPSPICNCHVADRTNMTGNMTNISHTGYDTNNLWWLFLLLLPLLFVCVFCARRRCCARLRVGISRSFRKYGIRSRSWPNHESRETKSKEGIHKAKSFNGFDSIVI